MHTSIRIALCGFGSAGRSRLQAIQQIPEFVLAGIVSRRTEVATISFTDALADPNIDVLAISTENADHPSRVRACLEADKHVLCDYPLAFSARELNKLFALAQAKQKILHIEQIGLLSGWHNEIKNKLSQREKIKSVTYQFTAKVSGLSGPPAFLVYPRLLQLFEWFGELQLNKYFLNHDLTGYRFESHWLTRQNIPLYFEERRNSGLPRERSLTLHTKNNLESFSYSPKPEGLFLQDLQHFKNRLLGITPKPYYDLNHVKSLTQILEKVSK